MSACVVLGIVINNIDVMAASKCERIFHSINCRNYDAIKTTEEDLIRQTIKTVSGIISDVENYLTNCTDTSLSLAKQPAKLSQFLAFANSERPDLEITLKLIEISNDGFSALLLRTDTLGCESSLGLYNTIGLNAVFVFDKKSKLWAGYPVWPIELLDLDQSSAAVKSIDFFNISETKVFVIDFHDAKGRAFMGVERTAEGGDNSTKFLTVIRWNGQEHKRILDLKLSDWCGQPTDWFFTKDGEIVIPSAKATTRCEKRAKKVYSLQQP